MTRKSPRNRVVTVLPTVCCTLYQYGPGARPAVVVALRLMTTLPVAALVMSTVNVADADVDEV
jgi:hypothetical protein